MSELDDQFCQSVAVLDLGPLLRRLAWLENGEHPHERTCRFHAYLAKTMYQFLTIKALLDVLQTRSRLRQFYGRESAGAVPGA